MGSDAITFFKNQKKIIDLLNRMEKINEKLIRENINVNLCKVKRLSIILISTITIIEIGLVIYNFIVFEDAIWFVPLYVGTVGKVFYVSLLYIVKEYFDGINQQLQNAKTFFEENKLLKKQRMKNANADENGYLHKEILTKRKNANKCKKIPTDGMEKVVNVIPYGDNGSFKVTF